MNNKLAAKAEAVNRAHALALTLYPTLVAIFKPLVGQKICKVDNGLMEKFARLLPELPNDNRTQVCPMRSEYLLAWYIRTNEPYNHGGGGYTTAYYEITLNIGNLREKTLTGIRGSPEFRIDYTVEDINDKRKAFKDACKAAEEARDALWPFGAQDY